jgi:hypothetical protein
MTDILELAREAGLGTVLCHGSVEGDRVWIEGADWHDELERFGELLEAKIRADEREACAALCSEVAAGRDAEAIEEAILARGKK